MSSQSAHPPKFDVRTNDGLGPQFMNRSKKSPQSFVFGAFNMNILGVMPQYFREGTPDIASFQTGIAIDSPPTTFPTGLSESGAPPNPMNDQFPVSKMQFSRVFKFSETSKSNPKLELSIHVVYIYIVVSIYLYNFQ